MLYLIIYDISSTPIRTKVAKILIREGYERLQLSVYLGLINPSVLPNVWQQLKHLLKNEEEAKFYVFPIPKSSIKNIKNIGKLEFDTAYMTGEKNSYFI